MNAEYHPAQPHLVLVGGGHAHVTVLKQFGMHPQPGRRLTLVSKEILTPYSGMLPGLIAGHYSFEETHIDLAPLARVAGARLIHAPVTGIDLTGKRIFIHEHEPLTFDWLSINTGCTPRLSGTPGAAEWALALKPIDRFLVRWNAWLNEVRQPGYGVCRVLVVGGGAGGVEVLLSIQHRLRELQSHGDLKDVQLQFSLATASATLLSTHPPRVQAIFERFFQKRGVAVFHSERVIRVEPKAVHCESGLMMGFDLLIWVTQASAPSWIRESGLSVDDEGFIRMNEFLQSESHSFVFAAGDVATMTGHVRPKAGVFAVRQGYPLWENLCRIQRGDRMKRYVPQREFLTLISTGDRYAVGSKGRWNVQGRWVWRWKDWVDRSFMRRYQFGVSST